MSRLCIQDSWLSYNPVDGCSGNCVYCFQSPKGLTGMKPILRAKEVTSEYDDVIKYYQEFYGDNRTNNNTGIYAPIAIGTDADMFDKSNVGFLYAFLDRHMALNSEIPIVIHTKRCIPEDFIRRYKNAKFMIVIAMSISLLPKYYEPGILPVEKRIENAISTRKTIELEHAKNVFLLHKWQPFIETEMLNIRDSFVKTISETFDASILIGLRITHKMFLSIKDSPNHPLFHIVCKYNEMDEHYFDGDAKEILDFTLQEVFDSVGDDYPVFRNSSCAISYFAKMADYTGTYWRGDICEESICPSECRERCWAQKESMISYKYDSLPFECEVLSDHIRVLNDMDYEFTIANTHLIGKPVIFPTQLQKMEWYCGNYRYYYFKYYSSQNNEEEKMKT